MALGRRLPLLPTLLVLALLAFVIERLVVTDLEALDRWAQDAADAVNMDRRETLASLLAEDFRYGQMDRKRALDLAFGEKGRTLFRAVEVSLRNVEVEGDRARADARVFATYRDARYPGRTQLAFVRGPDGWLLESATPIVPGY